MKNIFKILFVIILCIFALSIYLFIKTPKYAVTPVGPYALSSEDFIALREKEIIESVEQVVLMYSLGDISESGCILKLNEIVCYEPGQNYKKSEHVTYDSILSVEHFPSNSIIVESRIDIITLDSSVITIGITRSNKSDYKYFNKIKEMMKNARKNETNN